MRLLLAVLALAGLAAPMASAQTADSVVVGGTVAPPARPAWVSLSSLVVTDIDRGDDRTDRFIGGAIEYHRAVGAGRLLVQGGLSAHSQLFGRTELIEGHVAAGVLTSSGSVLFSAVAGPSVAHIRRAGYVDPQFQNDETQLVPGLYIGAQATAVLAPVFGLGLHAFGHLNPRMPVVGAGVTLDIGRFPAEFVPDLPPTPRRPGP